jgi:hypothetical protein
MSLRQQLVAALCLSLSACVSTPQIQVGQRSGARLGLFWFSGLSGDQASDSVSRQLLVGGYNLVDAAALNKAVIDTKFNALQISTDSLAKLRTETGVDFLLIGSSAPITGMFNFSHARMSLTLVDVRRGNVVWTKQCGNSIWNGVVGTKNEVESGARFLVGEFDTNCSALVKGNSPPSGGR